MSRPRIALLDASDTESTRRNFRRELDAALVEFDANEGDLPETLAFDGAVVTGSRSSVYWQESWIPALIDWLAEAAEAGLPILGVCYGHQALAEALGGRVAGMDDAEIGYRTIERRGDDELFAGIDEQFTAFTTHSDTVVDLPPGATLLAENDFGVHAFRKNRCWGVQFHPEYDSETARQITRSKDLPAARLERVLDGIDADNYAAACETKQLFDNFLSSVRRLAAESATPASA
jgi:GMP synthase (glutamine-hydrolysing)